MADFFDKFYKDVSKTVRTVKTKSETFVESTKIKNQIKLIEEEENLLFQELGRMLHISIQKDSLNEERFDELKVKSNEIKKKEEQILKLKQILEELEFKEVSKIEGRNAIGKCPNCGAVVYEGDKFCGVCGFKLEDTKVEKVEELINPEPDIICPNCGYKNPLESKFCIKCGTPLVSDGNKNL